MRYCIFVHRAIEETSPHSAQTRQMQSFSKTPTLRPILFSDSVLIPGLLFRSSSSPLWLEKFQNFRKSTCFWPVALTQSVCASQLWFRGKTDRRIHYAWWRVACQSPNGLDSGRVSACWPATASQSMILIGHLLATSGVESALRLSITGLGRPRNFDSTALLDLQQT